MKIRCTTESTNSSESDTIACRVHAQSYACTTTRAEYCFLLNSTKIKQFSPRYLPSFSLHQPCHAHTPTCGERNRPRRKPALVAYQIRPPVTSLFQRRGTSSLWQHRESGTYDTLSSEPFEDPNNVTNLCTVAPGLVTLADAFELVNYKATRLTTRGLSLRAALRDSSIYTIVLFRGVHAVMHTHGSSVQCDMFLSRWG